MMIPAVALRYTAGIHHAAASAAILLSQNKNSTDRLRKNLFLANGTFRGFLFRILIVQAVSQKFHCGNTIHVGDFSSQFRVLT
jgi:hypothetical protein